MRAKFTPGFVLLAVIGLYQCAQPSTTVISAPEARAKKLIYYGWGSPDTLYVREHWRQMEEMPFDGVGIVIPVDRRAWQQGKRDTNNQLAWKIMGKRAFRIEDFHDAIADLRAPKWRKFTDNFLPVILSAAQSTIGLNWFDNERWRIVANNFEILARIAAETGVKGLIFDPEHYNYSLFDYSAQRKQLDRPMAAYQEMARQRGREVMRIIATRMPEAVMLSLYLYTYPLSHTLPKTPYNLLPAFYDGVLEAMPSAATLIDGYESAYPYKEPGQFIAAYRRIQEAGKISAVPDHYRTKVKAGFGLWLDYRKRADYFTPEEFRRSVGAALQVSDGYVWIYSEGARFFPPSGVAPDYIKALADARRTDRKPPAPDELRFDGSVK
jgi:hypothetical protein